MVTTVKMAGGKHTAALRRTNGSASVCPKPNHTSPNIKIAASAMPTPAKIIWEIGRLSVEEDCSLMVIKRDPHAN